MTDLRSVSNTNRILNTPGRITDLCFRVLVLELVQRSKITREEGDKLLEMLSSKNESDVNLVNEMLNNLK